MTSYSRIVLAFLLLLVPNAQCACDAQQPQPPGFDPIVAVVLGNEIRESDLRPADEMVEHWRKQGMDVDAELRKWRRYTLSSAVHRPLREKFVRDHNAQPSEEEIRALARVFVRGEDDRGLKKLRDEMQSALQTLRSEMDDATTSQERKVELGAEIEQIEKLVADATPERASRQAAEWFAGNYKVQQALYKKYGGRAGWQQVGPEAPDAMRMWLEEAKQRSEYSFVLDADEVSFLSNIPKAIEPISFEMDNPREVFESIEKYIELNRSAK